MHIGKTGIALLTGTLMLLYSSNAWSQNDAIVGLWQDEAHPKQMIRVYRQGDQYFGKKLEQEHGGFKEGKLVFRELQWNGTLQQWTGLLVNPANNSTYTVAVKPSGKDQFHFKAGTGLFSRSFTFKRVVK